MNTENSPPEDFIRELKNAPDFRIYYSSFTGLSLIVIEEGRDDKYFWGPDPYDSMEPDEYLAFTDTVSALVKLPAEERRSFKAEA